MYISKYSNDKKVSEAQYITEIICEHKAKKDKKDLHFRFWLNKTWERFFRDQIATAHKLLKKYSASAIIKALCSDEAAKIYSLRAPHLIAIIDKFEAAHQKEINTKKTDSIKVIRNNIIDYKYRSTESNKNILSKLKELEDDPKRRCD